jgi:predicted ester cyclase
MVTSTVAPTGKKIEGGGVQIGRLQDDKIVERWGSSDEPGILKQLGRPDRRLK